MSVSLTETAFLEAVEQVAQRRGWVCRKAEHETLVFLGDGEIDYTVSFLWQDETACISVGIAYTADERVAELKAIIARVNEHLWVGHFNLFPDLLMFRYGLPSRGLTMEPEHIEAVVEGAVEAFHRYLPVFEMVRTGAPPDIDIELALSEPKGRAH